MKPQIKIGFIYLLGNLEKICTSFWLTLLFLRLKLFFSYCSHPPPPSQLLQLWEKNGYFDEETIQQLQNPALGLGQYQVSGIRLEALLSCRCKVSFESEQLLFSGWLYLLPYFSRLLFISTFQFY